MDLEIQPVLLSRDDALINRRLTLQVDQNRPHRTPRAGEYLSFLSLAVLRRLGPGGVQKALIWLVLIGSILITQAQADKDEKEIEKKEYEHRAMLLTQLATYTVWTSEALSNPSSPFKVGLFVPDEMRNAFDVLKRQQIHGHRVTLLLLPSPEEANGCQLLYFAASKQQDAQGVITKLRAACILTVGETEAFAKDLGAVSLIRHVKNESDKVKFVYEFEVNRKTADKAHLNFDPILLSIMKELKGN